MWTIKQTSLGDSEILKAELRSQNRPMTMGETIAGWKNSERFRSFFIAMLASTPFEAFFWETPPVRGDRLNAPYEHVVMRGDALNKMTPDAHAFAAEFRKARESSVATFRNLGGDALLIAPRPALDQPGYGHLAAFLRFASRDQQHALFEALGGAVEGVLAETAAPLWISTSGLGVPWLHIRLDARPKYYNFMPYRAA